MKKVLFFFLAFVASVAAFAQVRVTALDQLSNDKTYIIHAENGQGYLSYRPAHSETGVYVCGATFTNGWDALKNMWYREEFDQNDPNNQWQILNKDETYYLYNVGAKKYTVLNVVDGEGTRLLQFTDTPTALTVNAGETFAFAHGDQYFVLNQFCNTPIRNGGAGDATKWVVEEIVQDAPSGPITALDQLSNDKTYTIHAKSGFGYICNNPELCPGKLFVCGATATNPDAAAWAPNYPTYQAEMDKNDPNNLWQIVNDGGKYYLYNVGAKQFVTFATPCYVFTDTPTAIELQDNGAKNENFAGTFGFRYVGGSDYEFLCIAHNEPSTGPVRWWSYNDDGAAMVIEEAEYPADDLEGGIYLYNALQEYIEMAKAEYENGSVYAKSDNLYTDPSQFYSKWTERTEGSVKGGCDGDPDTYWHSNWQDGNKAPGTHDFYITLPETVGGEMQLSMTRRNQAQNDHILAFDVYAAADAQAEPDGEGFEFVGTVNTPFGNKFETLTGNFTVPEGTKQLRFVIAKTDLDRGYGHFAEFQLYAVSLDPECYNAQNPKAAAALKEAIEKAESLSHPTEEDIMAFVEVAMAYAEGDQPEPLVAAIHLAAYDNLYFSTTEVIDNAPQTTYSLSNEPEYFTFTPTEDGGYILQSTSTDKYVGHDVANSWDFSDDPSTWYIDNVEGEPTAITKDGYKGFGVDGYAAGSGVFTDKTGFRWVVEPKQAEEPVEPVEPVDPMPQAGKAYNIRVENFGTSDKVYYVGAEEKPETEPVAWLCSVDEKGMYTFMNESGEVLHFRGWEDGGTTWGITPMTELTADDMNAGSLPEEYIKPEVVVMQGYHKDGRFIYLNVNLSNGNYDHGANLFAPWNSSYSSFFVFEETEVFEPVIEWNGEIGVKEEATTIDELLEYPVEFKKAQGLSVSPLGLLGAIFNESGDVYAVAFVGQNYEQFGGVEVKGSTFNVQFEKVADIKDELKESVIQKIGGFIEPTTGVATVYFCPKSFVFDGATYGESLKWEYTLAGSGTPTGIESVGTDNATDAIYDLQGRRVVAPVKGNLYIQNGKKVMK